MEFVVPEFIEKELKIVGPFSFKQFIFIAVATGLCIFFYFTVPLPIFVLMSLILMGGALALALGKIQKIPLPIIVKNFFLFLYKPKVYLWKKKNFVPIILKKKKKVGSIKEKKEKGPVLKLSNEGRLKELLTRIETKK